MKIRRQGNNPFRKDQSHKTLDITLRSFGQSFLLSIVQCFSLFLRVNGTVFSSAV